MVACSRLIAFDEGDEEWHARRLAKKVRRLKVAVAAHRRRVVAALDALKSEQGPQGPKRRESPFSWADHLARLTAFKQRYRLDWDAFNALRGAHDTRTRVRAGQVTCANAPAE